MNSKRSFADPHCLVYKKRLAIESANSMLLTDNVEELYLGIDYNQSDMGLSPYPGDRPSSKGTFVQA